MKDAFNSEMDSRQKHAEAICYFYKQFLYADYKSISTDSEQDITSPEEGIDEQQIE